MHPAVLKFPVQERIRVAVVVVTIHYHRIRHPWMNGAPLVSTTDALSRMAQNSLSQIGHLDRMFERISESLYGYKQKRPKTQRTKSNKQEQ